jgi:putative transposase
LVRQQPSYYIYFLQGDVNGPLTKQASYFLNAFRIQRENQNIVENFATQWDNRYPSISSLWRRNWAGIIPFFDFPPEIRRVIYTTNAIESLNMTLRKVTKTRGSFPNEDAAIKLLYLALRNLAKKWNSIFAWKEALNRFAILWEDRLPLNLR